MYSFNQSNLGLTADALYVWLSALILIYELPVKLKIINQELYRIPKFMNCCQLKRWYAGSDILKWHSY